MRILRIALLLVNAFLVSRLASGAAVDRYVSKRPQHTSVINLRNPTVERRVEDDSTDVEKPLATFGEEVEEEEEDEQDYYYDDEEDLSGDYEVTMPRVAMSSQPKDPSVTINGKRNPVKRRKGKKGKGKKRNPCLKKYKDFCIHGTCQYLRDIRAPSCVCHQSYSGDRCQFFILPSEKREEGYNRTTALAVVAVVLSSLCLTIIGLLLVLRFHNRGAYDVESEEKVKLGSSPNH
ncbi:heparin-binding EGF-like growth factor a [Aplochiton taeniatus]